VINDIILRRDDLRRSLNVFGAILFIAVFSISPVFSSDINDDSDKIITGTLIKVDIKNQSIFVKENARIVKFKAAAEFCREFKDKINSEVDITYKIMNNKSLQLVSIKIAEKKEKSEETGPKSKSAVKVKVKK